MRLLFDAETDNLLPAVTRIWCIVARDLDTDEEHVFRPDQIGASLELLSEAEELSGHNIIGFDLPVLAKLRDWRPRRGVRIVDTLAWSRASWPEIEVEDFIKGRRPPGRPHSLDAWGHRLACPKSTHGDFSQFSEELLHRCRNDVVLNRRLYAHLLKAGVVPFGPALDLENRFAMILARQERHGVALDLPVLGEIHGKLVAERDRLEPELRDLFAPWYKPERKGGEVVVTVPKVNNKTKGVEKGCAYVKLKRIEFNPTSRDHIADRFQKKYGWRPAEFTDGGTRPKVDDEILNALPYPEAPKLAKLMAVQKLIGTIAEGPKAWLKLERGGRIYGTIKATGARTARCSHSNPNTANIPVRTEQGRAIRAAFIPDRGHRLTGADAEGLEMRMLGSYLALFDSSGKFIEVLLKEDIHTYMMQATGLSDREDQKTWTYARLYGAQPKRLASYTGRSIATERAAGARVEAMIPGMAQMGRALDKAHRRGYVVLPDGRKAKTKSRHDTLNTLLQGSGAIVMKLALVVLDDRLQDSGWVPIEQGGDYEFVLNVHDEFQATSPEAVAKVIADEAPRAIRDAGLLLGLKCPLDGKAKIGDSWAQTH